ncbi:ERM multi-domain protein [Pyrenophora teres f. maculata]|nr:ERM multi-domain protein [Pyrenophora teres f. maculata]
MAGEKKKRAAPIDKSEPADQNDVIRKPRAKKSRAGTDKYNPKYMAKMCFSAYALRLHEAALPVHTEDVAEDFRQDLLEIFTHAHTKGNFKQGTAARHMIPRLAGNANSTRAEKDTIVKVFVEHYNGVRKDLEAIDELYNSDKSVNDEFVTTMRTHVAGLHKALAGGAKWRGILPYTPLPMECLTWLSWSIAGRKPYQLLGDLISYIEDVKNWLTIPPPKMELHPDVRASIKETLRKENGHDTEEKAEKAVDPPPEPQPDAEAVARLREKVEEQMRQQKEKEGHLERREKDLRVEAKRMGLQKEKLQEQEKHSQEALQRANVKTEEAKQQIKELQDAAAKQSAEEIARQQKDAAAATEREDAYKKQMALNAKEVSELQAALSAAKAQIEVYEAKAAANPPTHFGGLNISTVSSVGSNNTTNKSIFQPQNSFGNYIGSNGYHQPFFNMVNSHVPGSPDPLPMEDIRNLPIEAEQSTKFGTIVFPRPGIWDQTQPIQFASNGFSKSRLYDPTQPIEFAPLNHTDFEQGFKEACRAWKEGKCPRGKRCKHKHEPCKKWMKGRCRFGASCYNSHDPFFKLLNIVPQNIDEPEEMNIDSSPRPQPTIWTNVSLPRVRGKPFSTPSAPKGILKSWNPASLTGLDSNDSLPSVFGRPTRKVLMNAPTPKTYIAPKNKSLMGLIRERENTPFNQDHYNLPVGTSVAFLESQKSHTRKKQACKNFLRGKCENSDEDCLYAHKPCQFFINNVCRFGNKCKESHDVAFLNTGNVNNPFLKTSDAQNQTQRAPHPLSEPPLTPSSFRYNPFAKEPQLQGHSQPQFNIERSLDDLLSLAAPKSAKAAKAPVSGVVCKFIQTRSGCTKSTCTFNHGGARNKQQASTQSQEVAKKSHPHFDKKGREFML